jgi:hypothetical protein
VASGLSSHGARSCEQTLLEISIVPMLSGHWQSRCADIAQAIDWLVHLHCQYVGEKQSTHSAGYAEVDIVLS